MVPLLALGPVLLAVGGLVNNIALADVADEFLASGERTNARAEDLLEGNVIGGSLQAGGVLCVALSFVLVSLNAMRAGLLSRFMGILGIVVGVLYVLPLLPGGQSFVQLFWLGAVAASSSIAGRAAAAPRGRPARPSIGPAPPASAT